jgi:hypothetical protein
VIVCRLVASGSVLLPAQNAIAGSAASGKAFSKSKILGTQSDVCKEAIVQVRNAPS